MLRLKQALQECGILQKAFGEASGWSKTQISLTLGSGKLPADKERFVSDVIRFVQMNEPLAEWLGVQNLPAVALLETVGSTPLTLQNDPVDAQNLTAGPCLQDRLLLIAGEAAMFPDDIDVADIITLTRACSYLLLRLEPFMIGDEPTHYIESRVMDILEGL